MAKTMAYISFVLLLTFLTSSHVSSRELWETSSKKQHLYNYYEGSNVNDNFEHPMNSKFEVGLKNKVVQLRPSILPDDDDDAQHNSLPTFVDPDFPRRSPDLPFPAPFPPFKPPPLPPFGSLSFKDDIEGYQRVLHRSFGKSFGMKNGGKTGFGGSPSMEDPTENTKN